ncbi:uncharacterized protein LOC132732981 isoform X2 [Ruditapes philippinarum]|nr:uncharacterized protein LOC132732981 isoform X2 [Ruditapes philippinarum]XP_060575519.1 uncharacterized protein LOC132732981 isoform X2 [Ruditapes philippinarum]
MVTRVFVKDNTPTIKGSDIQIICEISQFTSGDVVRLHKTDSVPPTDLSTISTYTTCIPTRCYGNIQRHTFSPNSSGLTITVTNLNRTEDQKWWTCAINNQRKYLKVTVYTISQMLQFDNPPAQDQDLIYNSVILKCSTGCAYPAPSFTWYMSEFGESRHTWPTSRAIQETSGQCTDSEAVYTSTLLLQRYTVGNENTDKTVRFQCGIVSGNDSTSELLSQPSVNIRFAVKVTSVSLVSGNTSLVGTINVTVGILSNMTCTPSESRPTPTVIWYSGQEEKERVLNSSNSNFALIPKIEDNGKDVYCKAFNIQPENEAVSSNRVLLNVKERATVKSLYVDGHIGKTNVTVDENDVDLQLICIISGNPASSVKMKFEGKLLIQDTNTNNLNFLRTSVACMHGGVYTCEGQDILGVITKRTVILFVKCSPRSVRFTKSNVTSAIGAFATLTFSSIAYPTPGSKGFKWYKETFNEWIPLLSNEDLQISSAKLQTNLTIFNITRENFGKYRLTVTNNIGTYNQYYFLGQKDNTKVDVGVNDDLPHEVDAECNTFVIVTIILAVVIVVGIVFAVLIACWLKRKTTRKDTKISHSSSPKSNIESFDNTSNEHEIQESTPGVYENPSQQYTELTPFPRDNMSTYDIIQSA